VTGGGSIRKTWFTDTVGGAVAGLLAIPEAMAYALIIFTPLAIHRPEILPVGLLSCILAVVLANAIPCAMRGPRILISTPFSLASVMLGVLATQIVASVTPPGGEPDIDLALVLLLGVVSVSGLLQLLFGLLRLGDLAKYMPTPVIAGLRNGAALVILIGQVPLFLGANIGEEAGSAAILWPNVIVGLLTFAVMLTVPMFTRRVPGAIFAILLGTAVYYLLVQLGFSARLTDAVGAIPASIPAPDFADDLFRLVTSGETLRLLLPLLPAALALAILNTLQTLVAVVTADTLLETRSDSNKELVGQGLSNFASGLFGAMSASGAVGGTLANYGSGGRGILSRLSASGLALAVVLFLGPLVGLLPKIVLSGCLAAIALSMFDRPGFALLGDAIRRRVSARDAIRDLSIIATVMVILLWLGPLVAIAAGILVAVAQFVLSMSRDNVRRELSGASVRSYVHRNNEEIECLSDLGRLVRIVELEGPLFFGTSDRLATRLEHLSKGEIEFILLDFARVTEIDTTAVSLICQARTACRKNGCVLVLSSLGASPKIARFLKSTKLHDVFPESDRHPTIDTGLAFIEDRLLDRQLGADRHARELDPADIDVLASIPPTASRRSSSCWCAGSSTRARRSSGRATTAAACSSSHGERRASWRTATAQTPGRLASSAPGRSSARWRSSTRGRARPPSSRSTASSASSSGPRRWRTSAPPMPKAAMR
jgi:SulP family sulfate permease